MTSTDHRQPFDLPALWRADIISSFRLRSAERCAAASPAPGFPQVLDSLLESLTDVPAGAWLDVGGGLGGAASWIGRTRRRTVIVVDPAIDSLHAAGRLFPELPRIGGTGEQLPFRAGSVAVAILNGVVSLLDDVQPVVAELRRVLHPDGKVLVTDLWSRSSETHRSEPNTFWSLEDLIAVAAEHGFAHAHLAVGEVTTGWWSSAAEQVDAEMFARHAGRAEFEQWRVDQAHIRVVLASGAVLAAGIVLAGTRR